MVKCSYEQKPFRREVMRTYGADVTPSPSMTTEIGRKINAEYPGTTGSLGCALTGTGYFDMVAYGKFNDGQMGDYIPSDAADPSRNHL